MQFRRLGQSGLTVSTIGLGTVLLGTHVDRARAGAIIGAALDAGITLVDTSDSYGNGASESILGEVLGPRRGDVVLATKFATPLPDQPGSGGTSRRWIMRAVEGSLRRLRTDAIDLYEIHPR